jgi:hypothetical protein
VSDSLQDAVDQGIRTAFASEQETDQRAGIVVDWVLTCEIVGNDGEVWLHTLRSHDSTTWKVLGMVEAHAGDLRAAMLVKAGDSDDE